MTRTVDITLFQMLGLATAITLIGTFTYTYTKLDELSDMHGTYQLERLSTLEDAVVALDPNAEVSLIDAQHSLAVSPGFTLGDPDNSGQRKLITLDEGGGETIVQTTRGAKVLYGETQQANLVWEHDICRWHNTESAPGSVPWLPLATRELLPAAFLAGLTDGTTAAGVVVEASGNGRFVAVGLPSSNTVTIFRRDTGLGNCGQYAQLQVLTTADLTGAVAQGDKSYLFGQTLKFDASGTLLAVALPGDRHNATSTVFIGSVWTFRYSETTSTFTQAFDRVYDDAIVDATLDTECRVLDLSSDGRALLIGYPGYVKGCVSLFQQNGTTWNRIDSRKGSASVARMGECGGLNHDGTLYVAGAPGETGVTTVLEGYIRVRGGIGVLTTVDNPLYVPTRYAQGSTRLGTTCGMDKLGKRVWGGMGFAGNTSMLFVFKYDRNNEVEALSPWREDLWWPTNYGEYDNGPLNAVMNPTGTLIAIRSRNGTADSYQIDLIGLGYEAQSIAPKVFATLAPELGASVSTKASFGSQMSLVENGRVLWTGSGADQADIFSNLSFSLGEVWDVNYVAFTVVRNPVALVAASTKVVTVNTNLRTATTVWTPTGTAVCAASYLNAALDVCFIAGSNGDADELFVTCSAVFTELFTATLPAGAVAAGLVVDSSTDYYWACHSDGNCTTYNSSGSLIATVGPILGGTLVHADQPYSGSPLVAAVSSTGKLMVFDASTGTIVLNASLVLVGISEVTSIQWKDDASAFYISGRVGSEADSVLSFTYPALESVFNNAVLTSESCNKINLKPDGRSLVCASNLNYMPVIETTTGDVLYNIVGTQMGDSHAAGWTSDGSAVVSGDVGGYVQIARSSTYPATVRSFS